MSSLPLLCRPPPGPKRKSWRAEKGSLKGGPPWLAERMEPSWRPEWAEKGGEWAEKGGEWVEKGGCSWRCELLLLLPCPEVKDFLSAFVVFDLTIGKLIRLI